MSGLLSKRLLLTFVCTLVWAIAGGKPAHAQYLGLGSGAYGYYGLGSSLLWPLLYLGNRSINSSITTPSPYLPYNGTYYNPNTNFFNNSYAYRLTPQVNNSYQQTSPGINPPRDAFNSGAMPNNGLPLPAPDRHNQAGNFTLNTAVLDGFFQTVNVRYHSDLIKALHQADMHSWAVSIGLLSENQTFSANLSKARKNEISTVLKDNSLEADKKLDILRVLIR